MVRWYEGPARRDSGLVQLVGRRAKAERLATHHATHDCESECNGTRAGAPAGRWPGAVTTVRLNNKIRDPASQMYDIPIRVPGTRRICPVQYAGPDVCDMIRSGKKTKSKVSPPAPSALGRH